MAATVALGSQADALAGPGCDRHASPSGSDFNPGTASQPVRSIARLIEITGPGQSGCLPAGSTFVEPIGTFIVDNAGGAAGSPAVIRTDDPAGEPAIVKGAMWLKAGVHDVTFERLRFLDSPGNSDKGTMLVVDGDRIAFSQTEMTWPRGICLNAGKRDGYTAGDPAATTVAAESLVVERSRIHDCGTHPDIVASLRSAGQSGVHGLYLINAPGAVIRDNYVYDNVSRGIQLWPDVDGALVEHNVFDGNGSNVNIGSSSSYGHYSEGNRFASNVITGAVLRSVYDPPWGPGDTESVVGNFPNDGSSHGNVLDSNCFSQADQSRIFGGYGYTHTADVIADPLYVDRAAKDFRLAAGSPCAGKGPRAGAEPPDPASATAVPDTAAPRLRLVGRPRLRHGRRLVLRVESDEPASGELVVRRAGRRRAVRRGRKRVALNAGVNRLVIRARIRRGRRYRARLTAADAAGNQATLTVRFRPRRIRARPGRAASA